MKLLEGSDAWIVASSKWLVSAKFLPIADGTVLGIEENKRRRKREETDKFINKVVGALILLCFWRRARLGYKIINALVIYKRGILSNKSLDT